MTRQFGGTSGAIHDNVRVLFYTEWRTVPTRGIEVPVVRSTYRWIRDPEIIESISAYELMQRSNVAAIDRPPTWTTFVPWNLWKGVVKYRRKMRTVYAAWVAHPDTKAEQPFPFIWAADLSDQSDDYMESVRISTWYWFALQDGIHMDGSFRAADPYYATAWGTLRAGKVQYLKTLGLSQLERLGIFEKLATFVAEKD